MSTHPEHFPQTVSRRGIGGRRADLGDIYFRSCWEANYARYLNFLIRCGELKKWEYEPTTFAFDGIKRGSRFYTPDFLVHWTNGKTEFHEVKGYMDPRSATKIKRMKSYHPNVALVVIDKVRYKAIKRSVSGLIPAWE